MSLFDKTVQSQKGGSNNTQIIGISEETFAAEMQRKDNRIDQLLAEKEELVKKLHSAEKQVLETEIADLRQSKQGLEERLSNPKLAFKEHNARANQIAELLQDVATQQAIGENRIQSALESFHELEYDEIDRVFAETEARGIIQAAKSAFGRGLIAEDAIRWHDAAEHYSRAAHLDPNVEHLFQAIEFSERSGNYFQAKQFCDIFLRTARSQESPEHLAFALNERAILAQKLEKYEDAESLYREARDTMMQSNTCSAEILAVCDHNIACVVRDQGRFREAEKLFRDVVEIDQQTIGKKSSEYAIHITSLACLLRSRGKLIEAEQLLFEALEINRITFGSNHPTYAMNLGEYAGVVHLLERYGEAETLYREAIQIALDSLGAEHPTTTSIQANLDKLLAQKP